MNNYVILDMELQALRRFLQTTVDYFIQEEKEVVERFESGGYEGLDIEDYYNDLWHCEVNIQFSSELILYKVNALIENELQKAAFPIWAKDNSPQSTGNISRDIEFFLSGDQVSNLPRKRLIRRIEKSYEFKITDLSGAEYIDEIRSIVNDLKHRYGKKDYRKFKFDPAKLFEDHRIEDDQANRALEVARDFIGALWMATGTEPKLQLRNWEWDDDL